MRFIFTVALACVVVFTAKAQTNDYANKVNPFIGTGGHGHTYPGATVPFGMVQLSPDTRIDQSWDGCGGYHYSDSLIYGFSHTHLSGTGCTDYGDVMLMPGTKKVDVEPLKYASAFDHSSEKAKPGFYQVVLKKDNIKAELFATQRTGVHRYSYPESAEKWITIDLNHRDKLLDGKIEKVSDRAIQGYRRSAAWATDQLVYFYIEFSEPIADLIFITKDGVQERYGANMKRAAQIRFAKGAKPLVVKVALSSVDENGAKNNLIAESADKSPEQVLSLATAAWNKELSKIEVKGGTADQQTIFYTALYHTMTQPNVYNDADGRYRGRDKKIHTVENGNYYTVFSLWDTFRGLHPLLNLIDQKRTTDFINTFIAQYKQGGRIPVWELSCNETECMIGYHAVPVICEAMMKGLKGFNYKDAYEAARNSAMMDHFGLEAYKKKGFIESEDEHESVSKTLEYAYDDWCIAQMAGLLGDQGDYERFMKRSYSWVNLYDTRIGHMRPRYNGGWLEPFDPFRVDNNFTEANSWQYSFFVPHQLPELVKASGGLVKFGKKLDALFSAPIKTTGREQSDITGLIGQYAHGNEPSHHMAYLYSLIWQAPKTQEKVRFIMDNFYKNDPDGLIGNEDCGQMSAWFVWSAMGMYSVCPGKSYYTIGTPLFPEVKINLENGKSFVIKANQPSKENFYVQSATMNGAVLPKPVIQYADIIKGGGIDYQLGKSASEYWAKIPKDSTEGEGVEWQFSQAPVIVAPKQVFRDSLMVGVLATGEIELTVNGKVSKVKGAKMVIHENTTISARNLSDNGIAGEMSTAQFYKIPNDWSLKILSKYNPSYTAGGDEALIDGLYGDEEWRKGRWQGYQNQDVVVEVDLKKLTDIDTIGASFLQDSRSWILYPSQLKVESSVDGTNWSEVALTIPNTVEASDYNIQTRKLVQKTDLKARKLRITAVKYGNLPVGHQGEGNPAFIFLDELIIN